MSSHLKSLGLSTTQKVTFDLDSIAEKQTSFTVTSTDSHALKVAIAQATAIPGAIKFQEVPERVVAVRRFASRFDVKLGQELSKQLARDVFDDGLAAEISSLSDKIIVSENNDHKSQTGEACFDEVRVILSQHPWIHKLSNL